MMSMGDSEVPLTRRVLGDMTNQCRKRSISSPSKLVSGNYANTENFDLGVAEGLLCKKGKTCIPQSVSGKGKGPAFLTAARPGKYLSPGLTDGATQENARPDAPRFTKRTKKLHTQEARPSCLIFGSEVQCDISEDSSIGSEESLDDCDMGSSYFSGCSVKMEIGHDISSVSNEKQVDGADILTQQLFETRCPLGSSGPSGLSDLKTAGVGGLPNLNATLPDVGNTVGDTTGSAKACSCSLCVKAAYMWMDLHYQDTRGRLAALKKSRRHARSLEGKFRCQHPPAKNALDNSRKSAELEFDLMQHCRSLFLHTEDALVRETTQLHSNLVRLKELRENSKIDLVKKLQRS